MFHLRANSSRVIFECRSFEITLEILRSSFHLSISSRYVVAIFTADVRHSQNSLGSYTPNIFPSLTSVSPCRSVHTYASSFVTDRICHLVIPDISDRIVRISTFSQLCLSGRKTSSVGFHLSPVRSIISKCVFSHSVGTRDSKCIIVPMVSKGIKRCFFLGTETYRHQLWTRLILHTV
jgi:hypothetical protein